MKVALFNANEMNLVNVQANKIMAALDLEEVQKPPINLNLVDTYSPRVLDFLNQDLIDSFTIMSLTFDQQITLLNLGQDEGLLLSKYQNMYDSYKINDQLVDISYFDYLRLAIEGLYKETNNPHLAVSLEIHSLMTNNIFQ